MEEDVGTGKAIHNQDSPLGSTYRLYPRALAKYEDVIADGMLFIETLQKLHSSMGTKFMVPTVGGRELDLHKLFVDVTSRGGIEKVVKERKLKEVTSGFNFPPTATNASFVLRKYYLSLLNHYEQIYFFKCKGWNSPMSGPLMSYSGQGSGHRSEEHMLFPEDSAVHKRRRTTSDPSQAEVMKNPVVGVIEVKIESGYLVKVRIGEKILHGIVYHANEDAAAHLPSAVVNTISGGRRRRRRRKQSKLDPMHPKPNRSGYNFFFAEQHARLKQIHSGKVREISKMIGDLWNKLTESEKAVYQEIGLKDKERYRSEMAVYRERQKAGSTLICDAVPIQQREAMEEVSLENIDQRAGVDDGNSQLSSDMDGSSTESDSDVEEYAEAGIGTDSTSLLDDSLNEAKYYELRVGEQTTEDNEPANTDPSEEPEFTKGESSIGPSEEPELAKEESSKEDS